MKQVGLRLPDDLLAVLVEWAKREKRPLHAQLLWIVRHAMDEERAMTAKESL
jgi:hypothetical protein